MTLKVSQPEGFETAPKRSRKIKDRLKKNKSRRFSSEPRIALGKDRESIIKTIKLFGEKY